MYFIVSTFVVAFASIGADEAKSAPTNDVIERWIKQLANESFTEREAATRQLLKSGERAISALIGAAYSTDAETRARAIGILQTMSKSNENSATVARDALRVVKTSANAADARRALANQSSEAQILRRLEELGCIITRDKNNKLFRLHLRGNKVTGETLPRLRNLPTLTELNLEYTWELTDGDLQHLRPLKNLQSIVFSSVRQMTDKGLEPVKELANLRHVTLHGMSISDDGLKHLAELKDLQSFRLLMNGQVTGEGIKILSEMAGLETLRLYGCTAFADDGLRHLKDLSNLKVLDLRQTPITDTGLTHLAGLTNLETLQLEHTRVTEAGVKKLQSAIGKCKITHGGKLTGNSGQ